MSTESKKIEENKIRCCFAYFPNLTSPIHKYIQFSILFAVNTENPTHSHRSTAQARLEYVATMWQGEAPPRPLINMGASLIRHVRRQQMFVSSSFLFYFLSLARIFSLLIEFECLRCTYWTWMCTTTIATTNKWVLYYLDGRGFVKNLTLQLSPGPIWLIDAIAFREICFFFGGWTFCFACLTCTVWKLALNFRASPCQILL